MSLHIAYKDEQNERIQRRREWHVGEPLPYLDSRVISFVADGDELNLIMDAIRAATPLLRPISKVAVSEGAAIEAIEKGVKISVDAKGEMFIG